MKMREMLRRGTRAVETYTSILEGRGSRRGYRTFSEEHESADAVVTEYMEAAHGGSDAASFDGLHYRLLRAIAQRTMGVGEAPAPEPNWKMCRSCEERKPAAQFSRHGGGSYALRNECEPCAYRRQQKAREATQGAA